MQTNLDSPRSRGRGSPPGRPKRPSRSSTVLSAGEPPKGKTRAEKVIEFIEALKVPSGVGQGECFKLRPFQRRFIEDVYGPRVKDGDGEWRRQVRRAILSLGRKNGKALALETPLPTPSGWTTMGDIREGDVLFDEKGQPCRVTFATPVQHDRFCYRVRFADGAEIIADADHQWTVYSRSRHGQKLTLTTRDMAGDVVLSWSRADRVERNYSVDVAGPIECPEAPLPIPPYTFGVWLGDGDTDGAAYSGSEADSLIAVEVAAEGVPIRRIQDQRTCVRWSLSDGRKDRTKDCIKKTLRQIGVLGDKHIPEPYQRASIQQRMSLLQGLMDTDGYVSAAGQCEFVSASQKLADDTLTLIRGLGFKASMTVDRARVNGLDCGPRYRVQFWAYADRPVFRLPRKANRQKPKPVRSRNDRNYIVAIEPVESVPVRCIQVDSPSSLFLAGEAFTPTHNTALIAALVLVHLVGPEAIPNGEIYSAANDRDQAAIVFKVARQMVEAEPYLMGLITIVPSTKTLVGRPTGSFYRAVSAEAGTKFGFNPSVVVYDELAQARNRALYDALDTSMGARLDPLMFVISTQSNDPQHVLSQLIDDGLNSGDPSIVCHLHAVPDDVEDIFDEKVWKLANPALGDFRLMDDFRALAAKAKRMPAEEPKFRNLYLNQRVAPVASLIGRAEWFACEGAADIADGEAVYLALDLSSVMDLTALVMGSADDVTRVRPFFWKPAALLTEHSNRDFGSGNHRYREWRDAGHLLECPGRTIDPQSVALHIAELCQRYNVKGLAYDRWRMAELRREFDRCGLATYEDGDKHGTGLRLVPWGQGFRDMAPAIDALELAVLDRTLVHGSNPVLNWNMANAVAVMDPAGNRKIDKDQVRFRIDGAVALAMMMGLKARDRQTPPLDVGTMIV